MQYEKECIRYAAHIMLTRDAHAECRSRVILFIYYF